MQKTLIYLVLGATFATGCSGSGEKSEYRDSALGKLPFVYRMPVQQGNIITEDMVDRVQIGMTRNQVRYLLGTPMLVDLFHTDRWDYTYTIRRGHGDTEIKRLTLYFDGDSLARIAGDMQPNPQRSAEGEPREMIVTVPDWEDNRGFFARTLDKLGIKEAE